MEIFNAIFSSGLTRWSIPFFLWILFYLVSKFLGSHINDEKRGYLVSFLTSDSEPSFLGNIPDIIYHLYKNIFGNDFWSKKCFYKSILFSVFSFFSVMFISWCFSPPGWKSFIDSLISTPLKGWLALIVAWFLFCALPGYLFVGKTRFVLWVLVESKAGIKNTASTMFCDLFFSSWLFLVFSSCTFVSIAILYARITGKLHEASGFLSSIFTGGLVSAIFATVGMCTLMITGILYFSVPFANIFWACNFSSIWIWLYLLGFIASKLIFRVIPISRTVVSYMNVQEKPFECVGLVGGAIIFLLSALFNAIFYTIFRG